jgi:hypothetical protein
MAVLVERVMEGYRGNLLAVELQLTSKDGRNGSHGV